MAILRSMAASPCKCSSDAKKSVLMTFSHRQVSAAGAGVESQAPDAGDATGTAALRVSFRHAAAPAPDAQAGPP